MKVTHIREDTSLSAEGDARPAPVNGGAGVAFGRCARFNVGRSAADTAEGSSWRRTTALDSGPLRERPARDPLGQLARSMLDR